MNIPVLPTKVRMHTTQTISPYVTLPERLQTEPEPLRNPGALEWPPVVPSLPHEKNVQTSTKEPPHPFALFFFRGCASVFILAKTCGEKKKATTTLETRATLSVDIFASLALQSCVCCICKRREDSPRAKQNTLINKPLVVRSRAHTPECQKRKHNIIIPSSPIPHSQPLSARPVPFLACFVKSLP